MPRAAELSGKRFGRLIVEKLHDTVRGRRRWLCKCDCGNTTLVITNLLNMNKTKSCGCLFVDSWVESGKRITAFNGKPSGTAAFNHAKNSYIQGAKARGLSFNLTDDEFRKLTSGFCFYCGAAPSRIVKPTHRAKSGNYVCNGIDRLNSSLGYTIGNCVPCCTICNYAKGETSVEQFETWVERTAEFTRIKRLSEEEILLIVHDRLLEFQSGPCACRDNAVALTKIQEALMWLQRRTRERVARGVEGTSQK